MPVPTEAGALERFTPPSLANIPIPPVFLLKPGTRRDRETYQSLLLRYGYTAHAAPELRKEVLNGLEHLWDAEAFAKHSGRLRAHWDAVDYYEQRLRAGDTDATLDVRDDEVAAINALVTRVTDAWAPLRKLGADNIMFSAKAPEVMMTIIIAGWTGIDAKFARDGGVVPLDTIEQLDIDLMALEQKHTGIEGVGEPGTAFQELSNAVGRSLFLTGQEEKNSASPPPSSPTPPVSKTVGRARPHGRSKASATSRRTPKSSSRSRTLNS